ncbi:MAG: helix-turn-helix domain-containing protein [Betaproteobacteria bacterium]
MADRTSGRRRMSASHRARAALSRPWTYPRLSGSHHPMSGAPLGCVGVNWVQAAAQQVWRTPRGIARGDQRVAHLLGNRDSVWRVSQDGREAQMRPGDFVLVDARRPHHFDFPTGPSTVSLELPLDWMVRWVAEPEARTARPFRADGSGWSAALAAFARPWRPDMATAPPLPAELLTDQLGALLSLACCGEPQTPPHASLAERARKVLRERLSEPGLTAAQVAADLGCSLRSLHRALAAARTPFAQLLVAERLAVARQMLASPALRHVGAGEIGRRVGLLDASHFARLCRRHLGLPPSFLRVGR